MSYTGSCLCGGVSFRIQGELEPIQVCHCRQCRKAQGGPLTTVIPVDTSTFAILKGQALIHAYRSSPGKERLFCSVWGSPLWSRRDLLPDVVRIRAGLIDEPLQVRPAFHAHTGSRCNWWPIDDGLPQYTEGYVRREQ